MQYTVKATMRFMGEAIREVVLKTTYSKPEAERVALQFGRQMRVNNPNMTISTWVEEVQ